jgi:hypothetical protein
MFVHLLRCLVILSFCGNCLVACGGTSVPVTPVEPDPDPVPEVPSPFPEANAQYTGSLVLGFLNAGNPYSASGNLAVTVNFTRAGGQFTGEANDFVLTSSETLTGRIFVTNGTVTQQSPSSPIAANAGISGALIGSTMPNVVIAGDIQGQMQAGGLDVLTGSATGDAVTSAGSEVLNGSFSLAKQ